MRYSLRVIASSNVMIGKVGLSCCLDLGPFSDCVPYVIETGGIPVDFSGYVGRAIVTDV